MEDILDKIEEAKGEKIIIDLADLPKGLTVEQWLYYMGNLGVELVDDNK